jgi:choline-sulfatase
MHAGSSPTPIGPYTHYLQEKGMLQAFHEDYQKRSSGGWIKNGSHDSVLSTEDFADTYIGRRATEFIENIPDDFPWHMFVSFVGPHDPFDPPTEYGDKYRHAEMPPAIADNMDGKPEWVKRRVVDISPEEIAITQRQYCAATELIDDQIGEMLRALEQRGMLDNTYIIYSSDHGEMLGDHGLYTKSVAYEASLRVPLLVAGPGIAGNRISDSLVELIDLNPTICDLAGVPVLPRIDARSIAPVLRGETEAHRSETVSALRNFRCIRTATHKLIENYSDVTELYDLENDPSELHNIASSEREIVRTLSGRLGRRFRSELGTD